MPETNQQCNSCRNQSSRKNGMMFSLSVDEEVYIRFICQILAVSWLRAKYLRRRRRERDYFHYKMLPNYIIHTMHTQLKRNLCLNWIGGRFTAKPTILWSLVAGVYDIPGCVKLCRSIDDGSFKEISNSDNSLRHYRNLLYVYILLQSFLVTMPQTLHILNISDTSLY